MPATVDLSKLLKGLPRGAWVAISSDEKRVVAYAADLNEAIEKAHALGEKNPVVIRVPETDAALFL